MAGQEPAQADLEALAEEFGFITTNQIKELYALSSRITDLSELEIQLKTTPKNELTEQQKKILAVLEKIKNYPSILTDRDVIEIFATIDLNFFKGKNPEQVTIREILQQTYRKMTGEEKRLLKAKKKIEKERKQKTSQ